MKKLPIIEKMNPDDTTALMYVLFNVLYFVKGIMPVESRSLLYYRSISVREMQGDAGLQVTGKIDWKVWAGLLSMNWFKKVSGGDNITQLIRDS